MPRALLAAIAVLVSVSYPAAASTTPPVAGAAVTRPVANAAASSAVIRKVNRVRARYGLRRLRTSGSLTHSATGFARHLMRVDRFGHAPTIHASHHFRRRGEALALQRGWKSHPGQTVRNWMNSPPHRALLLSRGFSWVGVGRARGRFGSMPATIYVLHLGAR
jgi:uncharacterized protein YkwD